MKHKSNKVTEYTFILTIIFFILVIFFYAKGLTRDIYTGDIGDLVTTSCIYGVAHPPGYPLFTLLGSALCNLPLPFPPVTRVALISTIASLCGLLLFYFFSLKILKNILFSLLSVSILAFSHLFWLHAEIPEVFGLHHFFVITILYLSYQYYQTKKLQFIFFLAYSIGLSLTHHHTILLLLPSVGILILGRMRELWKDKNIFLKAVGAFFLGLTPYLYVPIASSRQPFINWGSVTDLKSLLFLIERRAYGGFAPSIDNGVPLGVKFTVVHDYFNTFLSTFSYQILFLMVMGVLYLLVSHKKVLLLSLLSGWFISGPLFIFYASSYYTTTASIGIIERFYSMSFVIAVFFIPYGLVFIHNLLGKILQNPTLRYVLMGYFFIIPIFMVISNEPKTNLSQTTVGHSLATDILSHLPKNSILFVSGDTTTFNLWYTSYVLRLRPDVELINPPGVGGNTFLDNELNRYRLENPQTSLTVIFTKTLDSLRTRRPIYSTYEIKYKPENSVLMPLGHVYQLIDKTELPDEETYIQNVEKHLRKVKKPRRETIPLSDQNLVALEIPTIYSNALIRIGDFIDQQYKNPARAETYYRRALWIDPDNPSAYAGLSLVTYKAYNDCENSLSSMKQAITLYPVWRTYYVQQYILADRCKKPKAVLRSFAQEYKRIFHEDLLIRLQKQYQYTDENSTF